MRANSNLPGPGNEPLPETDREWWTTGQVARRLGCAPRTVCDWIDGGRLVGIRVPGTRDRRVHINALREFERRNGYDRARLNQ